MPDPDYIPPDPRTPPDPWLVRLIDSLADWWEGILRQVVAAHPANAELARLEASISEGAAAYRRAHPEGMARGAEALMEDYPFLRQYCPELVEDVARWKRIERRRAARRKAAKARKRRQLASRGCAAQQETRDPACRGCAPSPMSQQEEA